MLKKAKEMGIEKDLDRLKAKKGFTYEGSNIFGALVHAANQDRKGQLSESLNEKEISTRFSEKESKKALQNLKNRDERKKFIAAAMQGKVDIGAEKNYFRKKLDSTKQQLKNIRAGKLSSEDYNMAEAQLIAEGEVTKMTKGTGWARSDAEKEMIRERVNLNKKQKEIKSDNANIKAIASLKTEEARLEDSKKFKEEVADLSFGKTISAYVKRAKDKAKSAIVTSATDLIMRKDGKSGAIKQQEAFAEARPEQARRVYQEKMAAGEQKAIQTKLASKLRDEISSLRDKKADKSLSTEQREDIDAKLQKANVAAHQTQNQIDNIVAREKQLENLEKFYGKYEPPAEQPKPAAVETKQPEPVPSAAPASSPPPPPSAPPKPEEKKS
jgi:hypothetical protein